LQKQQNELQKLKKYRFLRELYYFWYFVYCILHLVSTSSSLINSTQLQVKLELRKSNSTLILIRNRVELIDSFSTQLELNDKFDFRVTFKTIFSSRIIQQIIEIEKDNDYREDRSEDDIRFYNRIERKYHDVRSSTRFRT